MEVAISSNERGASLAMVLFEKTSVCTGAVFRLWCVPVPVTTTSSIAPTDSSILKARSDTSPRTLTR